MVFFPRRGVALRDNPHACGVRVERAASSLWARPACTRRYEDGAYGAARRRRRPALLLDVDDVYPTRLDRSAKSASRARPRAQPRLL